MEQRFVGIDVAKNRLDVHVRPSGNTFALARDGEGVAALVERLRAAIPQLIVLEATGGFEQAVAAQLAAARLPLVVVNPRQIRDFARATGRLAKTDRIDAGSSRTLPRRYALPYGRCRTSKRTCLTNSSPVGVR
jgi:transposase